MRGIERPISPMREGEAPEYTPTPKEDQNKDYEECKKRVEEEMTGTVKKYTIPKIKDTNQKDPKDQRSPRDPRNRSPVSQRSGSPNERVYERGYERGNTLGMLDRDSRSPERRHDWKKSSERGNSRDSSQEKRDSSRENRERRERSRESRDSRDSRRENRESKDLKGKVKSNSRSRDSSTGSITDKIKKSSN